MELSLNEYSTAALAYLGDSVLEVCVREGLVKVGLSTSARLNSKALEFVTAPKQAEAMKNILPMLTEEEEAVFKRGRNLGHTNTPKSATVAQYRSATGMETLFGYLHLKGDKARIDELFAAAYPEFESISKK
jgi:ribonuclease-3 family protein